MGLPIARITAATNSNDIIARGLKHGDYRRGEAVATQSPAMDIQVASNFERLYFEASGRDPVATNEAFRIFSTTGALNIPPNVRTAIDELFRGVSVSEAGTARSMLSTLSTSGELVDPHTAVALAVSDAAAHGVGGAPLVTLSTAHAAKFPAAVSAATGVTPTPPRACAALADRAERFDRLPADAQAVKTYVRAFARR
jgi:threonine synthase